MSEKWYGFEQKEFEFEGRRATVVFPTEADKYRNWTIKAEYKEAFPFTEIELLKRGYHVTWLENKTRFATKEDCDAKARFAGFLSEKYGLCKKCVPIGMSCGGAHAVNFAGFYPELIKCLFIDAPVLNFCSFPGKLGNAECEGVWDREFVKAYPGVTRAKLLSFDNHPISKIDILKKNRIPVIMLYGTQDTTVDYNENGKIFEIEYSDSPDLLTVIPRALQGHHPHGDLYGGKDVVDFITNCK